MKTTLTVNILDSIFVIDNDAYDLLKTYLDAIEARLKESQVSTETIKDIEARVSELFIQMGASSVRVVNIGMVREIIRVIGSPEIFGDDSFNRHSSSFSRAELKRKILRDPENRTIGGVCYAISLYLKVDPTLFKILFILAAIFGGSGVLAYFILWIVIPAAKTPLDLEILTGMKNGTIE
ncbi:MAG: PspC domain-containing protein [Rikenellaceae bacterium]